MITQNTRLAGIVMTVVVLLLIPLIAMQFTNEVNWSLSDFVMMGVLLLGAGLGCELVMRRIREVRYRIAICGVVLTVLVLIWIELAVGIFGSPFAGS